MPVIQGSTNFNIGGNANLTEIHGDATIIRFDGPFTENEKEQISEYIARCIMLPDVSEKIRKHSLSQSTITLPRAQAALRDYETRKRSGPCFKGTREALLRDMAEWVTGLEGSRIYVLSGLAGIGKSTVAYTIASRTEDLGLLGASFFFSRDEADRKNAKKLFTTLAFQLCVYDERFSRAIGNALLTERGSAATTQGPQEQLQALILEPLQSIASSHIRPILLVVDALDECSDEDSPGVLSALSQLVRDLPSFKIILTTRPQPALNHLLGSQSGHKIFHLQDIEEKIVDDDIRLYLEHSLSQEQVQARLGDPDEEWHASDKEIESLVRATGRLFIIASTAVLFILDKFASDPEAQMATLLRAFAQDRTPLKGLNDFYAVILRNAIPEDCDNADIVERYQIVVGTIVVIQIPLPITTLACLIDRKAKQIQIVLRKLQSVISLGSDNVPLIYHKSFPDYLMDPARCKDVHLRVDPKVHHSRIAVHCFRIMNVHLKYNILGLGDPARFMDNKDGLAQQEISDKQLREMIPLELQYATVYWANHFKSANVESVDLVEALEAFTNKHLLHWFEALSWIGKLDSAHHALRDILKLSSTSSELRQLLSEGLRFISRFHDIIERSALHMYYSALPFTPTESFLHRQYNAETMHNLCRVQGGAEKWDTLLATQSIGSFVRYTTFSLDSSMFASWDYGRLRSWDAATGTPIGTITGQQFAIASDFSAVASSEGSTVTFYNVKSGAPVATFTAPKKVDRMAMSFDGSRVAAGLSDATVGLWKIRENELVACHNDFRYDGRTMPMAFSPNGTILAYLSVGGGIKLLDGLNGRFVANFNHPSEIFTDFLFSFTNSRIAASSDNDTLTLWKSEKWEIVGTARGAAIGSMWAISTDGSLLATQVREKVKIWGGNSDPLSLIEDLDIGSGQTIWSLKFYADKVLAIANSHAVVFYDIKNRSFFFALPCQPTTLAFSPDCTRLAAGSQDGTVYLWDVHSIAAPTAPKQPASHVSALALSQDCLWLACKFDDGTLKVLETGATTRLVATHQGHRRLSVTKLVFSPDGKFFASGSTEDGITLWDNGKGIPMSTLKHPTSSGRVRAVAMSSSVLAAADENGIVLWDFKTLDDVGTIEEINLSLLVFSNRGTLLASHNGGMNRKQVAISDVRQRTTIASFDVDKSIFTMGFLPDDSQLVMQFINGDFQTFSIVDKQVIPGAKREHLCQLANVPVWHDIPVWLRQNGAHIAGLFPHYKDPVPVLWIPSDLGVTTKVQGSSIFALGCSDGRVILLH